jgi:hypothetical protein
MNTQNPILPYVASTSIIATYGVDSTGWQDLIATIIMGVITAALARPAELVLVAIARAGREYLHRKGILPRGDARWTEAMDRVESRYRRPVVRGRRRRY